MSQYDYLLSRTRAWFPALLCFVIFLQACNKPVEQKQEITTGPSNGLELTLIPVKNPLQTGDEFLLTLKVKNVSDHTIYLPTQGWDGDRFPARFTISNLDDDSMHGFVKLPLRGFDKLEPNQEFSCDAGMGQFLNPGTRKYVATMSIGTMHQINQPSVPEGYSGWTGVVATQPVSIDIAGPTLDKLPPMEYASSLNANLCIAMQE